VENDKPISGTAERRFFLAPHGIFRELLVQSLAQALCLAIIPTRLGSGACYLTFGATWCEQWATAQSTPWWAIKFLVWLALFASLCFCVSVVMSAFIIATLNSGRLDAVNHLMLQVPKRQQAKYLSIFPTVTNRHHYRIAVYTALYFTPFASALGKNYPLVSSLETRNANNPLLAFTALSVVQHFMPTGTEQDSSLPLPIRFVATYYSPVLFGFAFCAFSLPLYVALHQMEPGPKWVVMPSLCAWIVLSLLYVIRSANIRFDVIFRNYFRRQIFPKSMTKTADEYMRNAPDLAALAQNQWINPVVVIVITGLANLFAALLQSL
jgi:hypothetical protein